MPVTVIIPAAGTGKRFGGEIPKQFVPLHGIPVLVRTLRIFEQTPAITNVILATNSEYEATINTYQVEYNLNKIAGIVEGGSERQQSIWNALQHPVSQTSTILLVHDAVRPCITPGFVSHLIEEAKRHGAVIPGTIPKETVKHITVDGMVETTYPRELLRLVQTPQAFRRDILLSSYQQALESGYQGTDDASVVEQAGYPVTMIDGMESNLKITTRGDWALAELLVQQQTSL